MANATANWKGNDAIVLEVYDATDLLNAPFKVILVNSAKQVCDENGKMTEIIIPDPEGLVKAVAQARVLHPHKLNGAELKFLRSALGMKSKDLARAIAVTPEHMSRWEAGDKALSPQSEMLVRIYTFVSTLPFTPRKKEGASKIANQVACVFGNLSIVPCRAVGQPLEVRLERIPQVSPAGSLGEQDEGLWNEPTSIAA